MKKAYHIFWWNKKDGKESEELDVIVISSSIDKVFTHFREAFPNHDINYITNVELMTSTVVLE